MLVGKCKWGNGNRMIRPVHLKIATTPEPQSTRRQLRTDRPGSDTSTVGGVGNPLIRTESSAWRRLMVMCRKVHAARQAATAAAARRVAGGM